MGVCREQCSFGPGSVCGDGSAFLLEYYGTGVPSGPCPVLVASHSRVTMGLGPHGGPDLDELDLPVECGI